MAETQFEPQIGTKGRLFKLRENGTNGFRAETQSQPQTILKSILKSIFDQNATTTQNGLWCQFFERERKHPETPNPKRVELDNDNAQYNEMYNEQRTKNTDP